MKFKKGDKVKIIEDYSDIHISILDHAKKGEKKIVKDLDTHNILRFIDGTFAHTDRCKLIKPKLTEERVIEIVDERLDIHSKKLERLDKAINIAQQAVDIAESVKPKDKPKSGWYKDIEWDKWLMYLDFENKKCYGFDFDGDWFYNDTTFEQKNPRSHYHLADPNEVEQRMSEEAKRRDMNYDNYCFHSGGLRVGKLFGWNSGCDTVELFKNGEWAEIIKPECKSMNNLHKIYYGSEPTINGYEMKQDNDTMSFGCMHFSVDMVKSLYSNCKDLDISSIKVKTDEGEVEISVEKLKEIVDHIK